MSYAETPQGPFTNASTDPLALTDEKADARDKEAREASSDRFTPWSEVRARLAEPDAPAGDAPETTNPAPVSSRLGVDALAAVQALDEWAVRHGVHTGEFIRLRNAYYAAARAEGAAEERAAFVEQLRREKRDMPARATDAHGMLGCLIALYSSGGLPARSPSSGTEAR